MILRRLLLASLVAICGLNVFMVGKAQMPERLSIEYIPASVSDNFKCPTEDVGGWFYVAERDYGRQDEIYWVVTTPQDMVRFCGGAPACQYGIYIYALNTTGMYSLTLINHEYCHVRGWSHGIWVTR